MEWRTFHKPTEVTIQNHRHGVVDNLVRYGLVASYEMVLDGKVVLSQQLAICTNHDIGNNDFAESPGSHVVIMYNLAERIKLRPQYVQPTDDSNRSLSTRATSTMPTGHFRLRAALLLPKFTETSSPSMPSCSLVQQSYAWFQQRRRACIARYWSYPQPIAQRRDQYCEIACTLGQQHDHLLFLGTA